MAENPTDERAGAPGPSERPAGMPADWGLTPLGICMDLGGLMFVIAGTIVGALGLFMLAAGEQGAVLFLVAGATSVVRSELHRRAGRALVYGDSDVMAPLRRYLVFAAVHSPIAALGFSAAAELAPVAVSSVLLAIWLLAWPAMVFALVRRTPFWSGPPRSELPLAEDNGYESLAVQMVVAAAVGAVVLVAFALQVVIGFGVGGHLIVTIPIIGLLGYRCVLHMRAARAGLRGIPAAEFEEVALRYSNSAIVVALITAIIVFLASILMAGGVLAFVAPLAVFALLMAWPRIVSQLVRARNLKNLTDPSTAPRGRAPDLGLTALGWLLLGLGVWSLAGGLAVVVAAVLPGAHLIDLGALGAGQPVAASLVALAAGALQVWAGVELVSMTRRATRAVKSFAVAGIVSALWLGWEQLELLTDIGISARPSEAFSALTVVMEIVPGLVVPVAALALIRRQPAAVARVVSRAGKTP